MLALLAPAAENERVTALEPHDAAAGPGMLDQGLVDLLLPPVVPAASLAHEDSPAFGAKRLEQFPPHQQVVEHHVGLGQASRPADADQPGVAGAGPHQADGARREVADQINEPLNEAGGAHGACVIVAPDAAGLTGVESATPAPSCLPSATFIESSPPETLLTLTRARYTTMKCTLIALLALTPVLAQQPAATPPPVVESYTVVPLPASRPAATRPATSAPASRPVNLDPAVERILDRLEKRGDQIVDITTDITFTKTDRILEDKQVFTGVLVFKQDKPNPRFLIRFDKFVQEGVTRQSKEWHAFDGQWYIEAREKTKTIVRRQIVPQGETVHVFRLGQGPFPLPFGQKKADIVQHFDVKLIGPAAGDPPDADHLECTPLPGTDMARRYGKVHFYVDRQLDLPVSVRTIEKEEGDEELGVQIAADFPARSIKINSGVAGSALNLPDLKDYQVDSIPLGRSDAAPANR